MKQQLEDSDKWSLANIRILAMSFKSGDTVERHSHSTGQLIYAVSGIMELRTNDKIWRIPPQRGLWMPKEIEHEMTALSDVELRTVYLRDDETTPEISAEQQVISVNPLLRELILRGLDIADSQDAIAFKSLILSLVRMELQELVLDGILKSRWELPLPADLDKRLSKLCEAIIEDPGSKMTLDEWAKSVGASTRTLSRLFQSEFGTSFNSWRQQVRISSAMLQIDQGKQITTIAGDLGYETLTAFSQMFKKATGKTPSSYAAQKDSRR